MRLKNLETLLWLLDPNAYRRSGRSYTMAVAYVNIAMKYPGQWIYVRDHYPNHMADTFLLGTIKRWCRENLKKTPVEFKYNEFRILPEALHPRRKKGERNREA
jgi:hypothetical protein